MKTKLFIISFVFLLSIFFVNAYEASNILAYYSMENTNLNTSIFIDSINGYNLSNNNKEYCVLNTIGKVNNATYYGSCASPYAVGHNATLGTSLSSLSGYSINFWLNFSNSNLERFISISNGTGVGLNSRFTATTNFTIYNSTNDLIKYDAVLNGWNMITILHDQNNNMLQLYVNGILVKTNNTASDLYSGSNKFGLGYPLVPATMFDEVSIYNTLLTPSDILILYNSGNGLNSTQTISNSQPVVPKCITTNFCNLLNGTCGNYSIDGSQSLCSNPTILLTGQVLCNNADVQNCAQGCYEDNGVANCVNNCQNQCNVIGATSCNDTTHVSKCDDWNGDGCYEIQPFSTCSSGQFCLESGQFLGSCVNVTQNGTHGVYGLVVTPYSSSNEYIAYSNNPQTKTVTVNTIFTEHTQDFYTTGTTYLSRSCDYSETVLFNNDFYNVTSLNDSIYVIGSSINTDSIIKFKLNPIFDDINYNSEGWIVLEAADTTMISKLYYMRNYTAKSLTIFDSSLNIIYQDFSTNTYDDLKQLIMEYSFNFASKTYSVKVTFDRDVDNIIVINPQQFLGNDITFMNITSTTNPIEILEIEGKKVSTYNSFSAANQGTHIEVVTNPNCNCGTLSCVEYKAINGQAAYDALCKFNVTVSNFIQSCTYTTLGNHYVRTYGNNLGTPDYSVYTDYNVFIQGTGLTENEIANINETNTMFNNLSTSTKYWIMLGASLLALLIFTIVLAAFGEALAGVIVGLVISMIVSLVLTLIFSLSLLIPILYIIIGGSIVAFLIRKVFAG